ncbi:hypothetical protein ACR5MH_1025 (plasmid) [Streptomyces sp. L7]|uniref:hypothetical protein n=1 Tax=Streptomyces sp. L7 TaxID=3423954 RepID=UPI003D483312
MSRIDPAAIELPPTQPIDMTALLEHAMAQMDHRLRRHSLQRHNQEKEHWHV